MTFGARTALILVALLPVLGTIYQTLVLTDLVDEDIRRGIESDKLDGTWLSASWGLSMLYGVFAGLLVSKKIGPRNALVTGLFIFSLGNFACGYSSSFEEMMIARFVEGLGKGMAIVLLRSFLYSRFDGMVFCAVLCYGTLAYSTRGTSPMVAAIVNEHLGWRWVYWASVPLGIAGMGLILLLVPSDSHTTHVGKSESKPDGLLINLLVFWLISLLFVLGWRQREGAFTSNLFTGLFALNIMLLVVIVGRIINSYARSDQLSRLIRSRHYLCAMGGRMLLLLHLAAVLGVFSSFLTQARGMPAVSAGEVFMPASGSMAISFLACALVPNRDWRHLTLLVGVLGAACSVYWLATAGLATSVAQLTLMMMVWGACVGTIPASFLIDEVEILDKSDMPVASAFAIVVLATPLILVPSFMGTAVTEGQLAAFDLQRQMIRADRPVVMDTIARGAEYFTNRGIDGIQAPVLAGGLLAGVVELESVSCGIQSGLRLLAMLTGALGLAVSVPLLLDPGTRIVKLRQQH